MTLAERMKIVFDRTTVELHLTHDGFCVGHDTVGVSAIHTINFLPHRQFWELIAIDDDILRSFYQRYFHDTKIDILKLPDSDIENKERNQAGVGGKCADDIPEPADLSDFFPSCGDDILVHMIFLRNEEYTDVYRKKIGLSSHFYQDNPEIL